MHFSPEFFPAGEVKMRIQKGEARSSLIEDGQAYAVRVRALNAAGPGSWSMESEKMLARPRAMAPKVLAAGGKKEVVVEAGEPLTVAFLVEGRPLPDDVSVGRKEDGGAGIREDEGTRVKVNKKGEDRIEVELHIVRAERWVSQWCMVADALNEVFVFQAHDRDVHLQCFQPARSRLRGGGGDGAVRPRPSAGSARGQGCAPPRLQTGLDCSSGLRRRPRPAGVRGGGAALGQGGGGRRRLEEAGEDKPGADDRGRFGGRRRRGRGRRGRVQVSDFYYAYWYFQVLF